MPSTPLFNLGDTVKYPKPWFFLASRNPACIGKVLQIHNSPKMFEYTVGIVDLPFFNLKVPIRFREAQLSLSDEEFVLSSSEAELLASNQ